MPDIYDNVRFSAQLDLPEDITIVRVRLELVKLELPSVFAGFSEELLVIDNTFVYLAA